MAPGSGNPGVLTRIGRLFRGEPERLALDYLLAAADPDAPLADRVAWLTELLRWVRLHQPPKDARSAGRADGDAADGAGASAKDARRAQRVPVARIRFLLQLLDRHPEWKSAVARSIRSVLRDARGLSLFATTGLPREYGFWGELVRRIAAKALPEARVYDELADVFVALFPDRGDQALPGDLQDETYVGVRELLLHESAPQDPCWIALERDLAAAILVLAAQVAAAGLSESVRQRVRDDALDRSPFLALGPAAQAWLDAVAAGGDPAARAAARAQLIGHIDGCRRQLTQATAHLEQNGVSVGLVYRIALARQQLRRIERLLPFAAGEPLPIGSVGQFMSELIGDMHAQSSVRALVRANLDLLTRKIAERTGKTGEHYITRDRAEYADMLQSAGRGGAVTGLTAFVKFGITGHGLAPFVEGLAASLNYAISFCAIQVLHGTLATKQPAMTAATMAARLKESRRRHRLRGFVDEVAALTRSQVAAIAGNLMVVAPAAVVIGFAWTHSGGAPMPDAEKAVATIDSLDLLGATPFYAAFTGVLLWLSAVISGWIENWAVYRRLPEAIARQPRLLYAFGEARMQSAAAWFERNVAGLGGNVALGFLLGMTPVVAGFFGLPLEVRHVTLSTGALALSVASLGFATLATAAFWLACAGILVVGALNLAVSFTLALWVAIRATRAGAPPRRRVYRAVVARLVRSPRDFLLPPREPRVAVAT